MKLSITYLYTIFRYGCPPKPRDDFRALADIQRMGFHYLEMEALGPDHAAGVWENRAELKLKRSTDRLQQIAADHEITLRR